MAPPNFTKENTKVMVFGASYEGLGMVMDYVASRPPFGEFESAQLLSALKQQLRLEHNFVAVSENRVVGYIGWLEIKSEVGEAWQNGTGKLVPAPAGQADAAALTIVVSEATSVTRRLIAGARSKYRGKRVFFKRDYEGDEATAKKNSVLNIPSSG